MAAPAFTGQLCPLRPDPKSLFSGTGMQSDVSSSLPKDTFCPRPGFPCKPNELAIDCKMGSRFSFGPGLQ